jgi:hypothetical protein
MKLNINLDFFDIEQYKLHRYEVAILKFIETIFASVKLLLTIK